jgi:hypothetical protein
MSSVTPDDARRYLEREAASVTTVQAQQAIEGDLRARERALLKLGLADPQSMYLFPVALARKTKIRFPELDEK